MSDNTAGASERMIQIKLEGQGASEALAGAIADAAVRGGITNKYRLNVIVSPNAPKQINVWIGGDHGGGVPGELHDRLVDMGFEVYDEATVGDDVRYIDRDY